MKQTIIILLLYCSICKAQTSKPWISHKIVTGSSNSKGEWIYGDTDRSKIVYISMDNDKVTIKDKAVSVYRTRDIVVHQDSARFELYYWRSYDPQGNICLTGTYHDKVTGTNSIRIAYEHSVVMYFIKPAE